MSICDCSMTHVGIKFNFFENVTVAAKHFMERQVARIHKLTNSCNVQIELYCAGSINPE